jgi:hypothetical protein
MFIILAARDHCGSGRTRAAVSDSVVFHFYTTTPDYSIQIQPVVHLKTGSRLPFSLPRFLPVNIFSV